MFTGGAATLALQAAGIDAKSLHRAGLSSQLVKRVHK